MRTAPGFEAVVLRIQTLARWVLLAGIALMGLMHAIITWAAPGTWSPALADMVNVDREHNIPTWFSSAQIVVLALVFFAIAFHENVTQHRRFATFFWCVCGCVALYLSMDETAEIHEALGDVLGHRLKAAPPGTFLYDVDAFPSYYWALIYVPIAVPFGVAFGWFAIREMVGSRGLAIFGLVVFAFGAVVLDHLEGRYGNEEHQRLLFHLGDQAFRFDIFLVEELCEMVGVFMLIEAGFRHLLLKGKQAAVASSVPDSP